MRTDTTEEWRARQKCPEDKTVALTWSTPERRILLDFERNLDNIVAGNDPVEGYKPGWATYGDAQLPRTHVRMAAVLEIVAEVYGVSTEKLLGSRGKGSVAKTRHAAMAMMHRFTNARSTQIGRFMGRDESTVSHGIRHAEICRLEDHDFNLLYIRCEYLIRRLSSL